MGLLEILHRDLKENELGFQEYVFVGNLGKEGYSSQNENTIFSYLTDNSIILQINTHNSHRCGQHIQRKKDEV